MKKPDLIPDVFMKSVGGMAGGMANRQIARGLNVSPTSVDRTIARMGRHGMLKHCQMLETAEPCNNLFCDQFDMKGPI